VVITADDLSSRKKVVDWSSTHGLSWQGNEQNAQDILNLLLAEGPFLSPGKMTHVLGLHENNFVLPDETIGYDHWTYVPRNPVALDTLDLRAHSDAHGGVDTLRAALEMNTLDVISPVIAWMFAAPIRSLLREFPILNITGSAGTGKTVMIEYLTQALSGGFIGTALSGTTPYAVTAMVGATNGIPVWFDEYRAGLRPDVRDHLAQTLRSAYTGQATHKGAVGQNSSLSLATYSTLSPIIITGEDALTETSLTQRSILIQMPRTGRNPKALEALKRSLPSPIAHDYLVWLVSILQTREINQIFNYEVGPDSLASRQRAGLGVLDLGWKLLGWFLDDYSNHFSLPDPDWSRVEKEAVSANSTDPFSESISWALDFVPAGGAPLAWRDPSAPYAYVRTPDLISEVQRRRLFILPGGARALTNHLISLGGVEGRYECPGHAHLNAIKISMSDLFSAKLGE